MKKVALSVTLKAKPGKEEEVAAFLAGAESLVAQEAGTITWYAFRVDQRTFGIFDSFGSDEARQAHLQGAVAAALLGRAAELLDGAPRDPSRRHSRGEIAGLSVRRGPREACDEAREGRTPPAGVRLGGSQKPRKSLQRVSLPGRRARASKAGWSEAAEERKKPPRSHQEISLPA